MRGKEARAAEAAPVESAKAVIRGAVFLSLKLIAVGECGKEAKAAEAAPVESAKAVIFAVFRSSSFDARKGSQSY